jgi:hypothetical protein
VSSRCGQKTKLLVRFNSLSSVLVGCLSLYFIIHIIIITSGGVAECVCIEMPNLKSFLFTMPSRNLVSLLPVHVLGANKAAARRTRSPAPVFSTHKFVYPSHMGAPTIESGFLYYSRYNAKQRVGIESSSERGHGELLFKDARLCFQRSSNLSGGVLGQPGKLI